MIQVVWFHPLLHSLVNGSHQWPHNLFCIRQMGLSPAISLKSSCKSSWNIVSFKKKMHWIVKRGRKRRHIQYIHCILYCFLKRFRLLRSLRKWEFHICRETHACLSPFANYCHYQQFTWYTGCTRAEAGPGLGIHISIGQLHSLR